MVFWYVEGSRYDNDGSRSSGGHCRESLGLYSFRCRILDHLNPRLITHNACLMFASAFGLGRLWAHSPLVIQ